MASERGEAGARTLYSILGVAADATPQEIEAVFAQRRAALEAGGSATADELSLLRVAGATLRDEALRVAYDRRLQRAARAAEAPVPAPAQGGRTRRWLLPLLVGGGAAVFLWRTPEPAPAPPPAIEAPGAAPAPIPGVEESHMRLPSAAANEAPPPAPASAVPGATPPAPAAQAVSSEFVPPTRPARGPGFDAPYLAWSVFVIQQRRLSGSGVLIAPDRILTNCHVLAGAALDGMVAVHSMTRQPFRVDKYARLDGEDACLLHAPGAGADALAWGSSAALRPGDTLHTFGHPGGSSEITWSTGQFVQRQAKGGEEFLLSSNYCRPGSSGGPLVDDNGRLVGVVTAVQRYAARFGEPQYGYCVSVTEATARALLARPLFPLALAPAQYVPNY